MAMSGGGGAPRTPEDFFENLQKVPKKCNMHYFSLFYTKFSKSCFKFSHVLTKSTNCGEIFKKIWKFFDENSIGNGIFIYFWKHCC